MTFFNTWISAAGALIIIELVLGSAIICTVGLVEPSFWLLTVMFVLLVLPPSGVGCEFVLVYIDEVTLPFPFASADAGWVLSNTGRVMVPIVVPTVPVKFA